MRLYMAKNVLGLTLAFSVILTLTSACEEKAGSSTVYEREYHVDWEHGFQEGLGEVEVNGKWGFINSAGEIVIKPKFNQVIGFTEGLAIARTGAIIDNDKAAFLGLAGRWMHIDKKGQPAYNKKSKFHVIPPGFSEGLAAVCIAKRKSTGFWTYTIEEKWGFINTKGEMVIQAKYNDIRTFFSEGLVSFTDPNLKQGYINCKGEVLIQPRYHLALPFSEAMAGVGMVIAGGESTKWGFINKRGEVVIPLQYESVTKYSEGIAAVRNKSNKWGYIDKSEQLVIPFKFDDADSFSEGVAAVVAEGKVGYIDHTGEYIIEPRFEGYHTYGEVPTPQKFTYVPKASSFSDGLAAVMVRGKWGYIDKKRDFVIKPKFDLASPFTEGFAKVAVDNKLGYIDKDGKYIWEPTR